jgi:hypothetical protein
MVPEVGVSAAPVIDRGSGTTTITIPTRVCVFAIDPTSHAVEAPLKIGSSGGIWQSGMGAHHGQYGGVFLSRASGTTQSITDFPSPTPVRTQAPRTRLGDADSGREAVRWEADESLQFAPGAVATAAAVPRPERCGE